VITTAPRAITVLATACMPEASFVAENDGRSRAKRSMSEEPTVAETAAMEDPSKPEFLYFTHFMGFG